MLSRFIILICLTWRIGPKDINNHIPHKSRILETKKYLDWVNDTIFDTLESETWMFFLRFLKLWEASGRCHHRFRFTFFLGRYFCICQNNFVYFIKKWEKLVETVHDIIYFLRFLTTAIISESYPRQFSYCDRFDHALFYISCIFCQSFCE